MAHRYCILPDIDLLYLEYSGLVTREDQAGLVADTLSDPLHRFDMPKLSSTHNMTDTTVDFRDLIALRNALNGAYANRPIPVKWAQYAPGDLGYGMARMSQALLGEILPIKMEVFRNLGDALQFLDVPEAEVVRRLGL